MEEVCWVRNIMEEVCWVRNVMEEVCWVRNVMEEVCVHMRHIDANTIIYLLWE